MPATRHVPEVIRPFQNGPGGGYHISPHHTGRYEFILLSATCRKFTGELRYLDVCRFSVFNSVILNSYTPGIQSMSKGYIVSVGSVRSFIFLSICILSIKTCYNQV